MFDFIDAILQSNHKLFITIILGPFLSWKDLKTGDMYQKRNNCVLTLFIQSDELFVLILKD